MSKMSVHAEQQQAKRLMDVTRPPTFEQSARAGSTDRTVGLLRAIEIALPYIEKVAATAPTTHTRLGRQRQAIRDAAEIRTLIAAAKGGA